MTEGPDGTGAHGASSEPMRAERSEATPRSAPAPAPDPLRGFRGVVAATLVLEAIVVLLALLVVGKFGGDDGGVGGIAVVLVLAAALLALVRFAGRAWAATAALAVQVALILCGALLVGVLAAVGLIFGFVWFALFWMRRDVARRFARGELPGQRPPGPGG